MRRFTFPKVELESKERAAATKVPTVRQPIIENWQSNRGLRKPFDWESLDVSVVE